MLCLYRFNLQRIPALGLYLKFRICRISVYSGYELDRLHSLLYVFFTCLRKCCIISQNKIKQLFFISIFLLLYFSGGSPLTGLIRNICVSIPCKDPICHGFFLRSMM